MRKPIVFLSILFLSLPCLTAGAQDASASGAAGQERLDKLEKVISVLPRISGFINMRYQYNDATETNSFDIRRVRLDLRGDIGQKVGYRVQVDLAGSPRILDAYMTWKISDWVGMQGGQFKTPFSLENPYSPTTLETMDNSLVITALAGYADVAAIAANGRDIGLGFNGNFLKRDGFSIINWALGVFNGTGINRADNNKQKDLSGMLTINPVKNLALAAYHYNGWGYREPAGGNFRRIRSGGGVKYDDGRWLVRSEYIRGKTGGLHSEGAYAVAGYSIGGKVQPVLKYDYFQRDLTDMNTRWNYYTAGINYIPVKYCKLQLNYSYRTSPGAKNYNYIAAQIIGIF